MSPSLPKPAWHFDLHTPGYKRVNHKPDVKRMARDLKAAGVDEIITFATCPSGYAYYPTKVGTPHPRLKSDAFGIVLKACRAEGIRVLGYISFGIDGHACEKSRQWLQITKEGKPLGYQSGWFARVCPFTPSSPNAYGRRMVRFCMDLAPTIATSMGTFPRRSDARTAPPRACAKREWNGPGDEEGSESSARCTESFSFRPGPQGGHDGPGPFLSVTLWSLMIATDAIKMDGLVEYEKHSYGNHRHRFDRTGAFRRRKESGCSR